MGWMSPNTHMPTVNTPEPERKKHIGLFKSVQTTHAAGHVLCIKACMVDYLCSMSHGHQEPTYVIDV